MRGRSRMDRKIVELLMGGGSVKQIARSLNVSKSRVRRLRERSKEYVGTGEGQVLDHNMFPK
jgi:transposase-like protein